MNSNEILGRSTPYTEKSVLITYIVMIVLVVFCTVYFTIRGVMDSLQTLLVLACLVSCVGGLVVHFINRKKEVILYDDYLTIGKKTVKYESILKVDCARNSQLTITTGTKAKDKTTALVGNADALHYLINRKRRDLRKKK